MSLIVQKFGGTSVGSIERMRAVAKRVAATRAEGHHVVVVVSAMSGETNRLLGLAKEMAERPTDREVDVIGHTGELVSAALVAIALDQLGVQAMSMSGAQIRMRTDGVFTKARIRGIDNDVFENLFKQGIVPVVAGFQGVDDHGNVTTLGRGGSDTSAVAIAAAIGADVCEIYTDVDAIYTADPNVCPDARRIDRISFEETLELASLGAKVLQIRSVEVAMKYGVPVHVRSSFSDRPGTWVGGERGELEAEVVAGVTSDKNENKLTIRDLPDNPGVVATVFEAMANGNVSVDMIIQNVSLEGRTDLTFTVTATDLLRATDVAKKVATEIGAGEVRVDDSVAKVSIVGQGMRSHAGVAAKMFRLLAAEGINIQAISTSEIKVSCLIHSKYAELAVRALHTGFGLGSK